MIQVDDQLCPANHPCPVLRVCPTGAIKQKDFYSAPEIIEEKCVNCGKCTNLCPFNAFHYAQTELKN
jgi:Fe-S-cluster-containing hydrogenase component 2